MDWIKKNGGENIHPDMDYTAKQLFWISSAKVWCTKVSPDFLPNMYYSTHTPNEFRVIGALQNNEEFAKDFGCKVGSYMNPADRCQRIW